MAKHKQRKGKKRQHRQQRAMKQGQRMSFRDACNMVPDDLPDGAYFAMAHEFAGLDYGDGFAELADDAEMYEDEE